MSAHVVLNGVLREHAAEAVVPLFSGLASYGEGALEVFRTTSAGAYLLERHLARLRQTCERLGFEPPAEEAVLSDLGVLKSIAPGPWRVRLIAHSHGRAVTATPFEASELLGRGVRLRLREGVVTPLGVKTTSYAASRVFRREAQAAGFDECLLHHGGRLLEGAMSNILIVRDGVLVSPTSPLILPGITRRRVLELASANGVPTSERPVAVEELAEAEEVILTSAVLGPLRGVQIDEAQLSGDAKVYRGVRAWYEEDLASIATKEKQGKA